MKKTWIKIKLAMWVNFIPVKMGNYKPTFTVSRAMKELFSMKVSEWEVQESMYPLSGSPGSEYGKLMKEIRNAPYRHMYTTIMRENGKNMALWTFVTECESIFHVSESSNHEVAESILKDHSGTDIHDRHSSFETLASKTHNDQ